MLIKAVSIFLIAMVALGLFGKLRFGTFGRDRKDRALQGRKCRHCGGFAIGSAACPCGRTGPA